MPSSYATHAPHHQVQILLRSFAVAHLQVELRDQHWHMLAKDKNIRGWLASCWGFVIPYQFFETPEMKHQHFNHQACLSPESFRIMKPIADRDQYGMILKLPLNCLFTYSTWRFTCKVSSSCCTCCFFPFFALGAWRWGLGDTSYFSVLFLILTHHT